MAFEKLARSARVFDALVTAGGCEDLPQGELRVLRAVVSGVTTSGGLQSVLAITRNNIFVIIERLETRKLLLRMREKGKKSIELKVTKKGEEMVERFDKLESESRQRLSSAFGLDPKVLDAIVEAAAKET